mgnify:FL=1
MLTLSYSKIKLFLTCRRAYDYRYIRRLERDVFNIAYLVGNTIHKGTYYIYTKNPRYVQLTLDFYNNEVKNIRNVALSLSIDEEQDIERWKVIIKGMLTAYYSKYKEFIHKTQHMHNEQSMLYVLNTDTSIVVKPDNILKHNGQLLLHEMKSYKYVNIEAINRVETDLQTILYFVVYNLAVKKKSEKLHGIIYDIIQKPSIRRKNTESEKLFLRRLENYYNSNSELFYKEVITKPFATVDNILMLLETIASDMRVCADNKNMCYQNFMMCNNYGKCEYYELCHKGENKATLSKFRHTKGGTTNEITQ